MDYVNCTVWCHDVFVSETQKGFSCVPESFGTHKNELVVNCHAQNLLPCNKYSLNAIVPWDAWIWIQMSYMKVLETTSSLLLD